MISTTKSTTAWAEVDEQGRLILPPDVVERLGLKAGAKVRLDEDTNLVKMHRPITHLTKVYIEPTVECNLDCITCFRNAWDQPLGRMSDAMFEKIMDGLKALDPIPNVYFGGIGEPLYHQKTIGWIARAKSLGIKVELITNGTTLTEEKTRQLIDSGLDRIWISVDGATPETYADVRIGAELPKIIENIWRLARMRKGGHFPQPEIGFAFLAMKRNIADLPKIIRLARRVGAKQISVSNIQPATNEMQADRLYPRAMRNVAFLPAPHLPHITLPKMDFDDETRDALAETFNSGWNISFAGNNWGGANDTCNFVESGTMSIAWNGDVSPCWPLMHTHTSYLHNKPRISKKHVIGNVMERSLLDLWLDPDYLAYRERLHNFGFAPCAFCGGCELSEMNEEDCIGNAFPSCGGCLWAQGIVQCP